MPIAVMLCAVSAGLLAAQNTKSGTDTAIVQAREAASHITSWGREEISWRR